MNVMLTLPIKYYSGEHIKKNEMGGHVARMEGERKVVYRVVLGKPEGKRPVGRSRHRWEDNIKICLKGSGWEGVDCIDLA